MKISNEELKKYGYIPGEYHYICHTCTRPSIGHKHGYICRDCAIDIRQKMQQLEEEKRNAEHEKIKSIYVTDIVEYDDGSAEVTFSMSHETILLFAKQGLLDAIIETANNIIKEQEKLS